MLAESSICLDHAVESIATSKVFLFFDGIRQDVRSVSVGSAHMNQRPQGLRRFRRSYVVEDDLWSAYGFRFRIEVIIGQTPSQ